MQAMVTYFFKSQISHFTCYRVRDDPKLLGDNGEVHIFRMKWLAI